MSFLLKGFCLASLAGALFSSPQLAAQSDSTHRLHLGIVYPISSHGTQAADYDNHFSLHAIAGVSRSETGVALYGMAGVVKRTVDGLLLSGAINLIGGDARGALLAGSLNLVNGTSRGLQASGIANIARSSHGTALAGISNLSQGSAGVQVAGVVNVATSTTSQIAGLVNVAKQVKGIQLAALINIADSSDYPIGLLNFIKNGEKSIALTMDETLSSIASFRSGGRILYGILGLGYNWKNYEKPVFAIESGIGAHIPFRPNLRLNVEITNQQQSDFRKGQYSKNSLRILPAVTRGSLELFAGPTINYLSHDTDKNFAGIDRFLWSKKGPQDVQALYIGVVGGIQYRW